MKNIIILIALSVLVAGCSSKNEKPKSQLEKRLEQRFKQYAEENFYNPNDFNGFSAINITDTIDIVKAGNDCIALSDSIGRSLVEAMQQMNKHLRTATWNTLLSTRDEGIALALKGMDEARGVDKRIALRISLTELLNDVDSAKRFIYCYTLKARINGKTEVVPYYAVDCPFLDTILISNNPIPLKDAPGVLGDITDLILELLADNDARTELLGEYTDFIKKLGVDL